jgi:predicted DNA-binding transcriptional regulator AlpA
LIARFQRSAPPEVRITGANKMLSRQFRFRDLEELGVVRNRVQLTKLIATQGFPPGRMLSPNCRVWDEDAVAEWLESRPVAYSMPLRGGAKLRVERARGATT